MENLPNHQLQCIIDMKASTRQAFDFWMSQHPESAHGNDNERFKNLIKTANRYNDLDAILELNLYKEVRKHKPLWIKEFTDEFVAQWQKRIIREVNKYKRRGKSRPKK